MNSKPKDLKPLDQAVMDRISADAKAVIEEVLDKAKVKPGQLFIIGCSSSEIIGSMMGSASSADAAEAVYAVVSQAIINRGAFLAVQCCEHLNRAVVLDRSVAERYGFEQVNVIPQYHAGGAFAVTHYQALQDPVVVENIGMKADAGMDIGGVMIGMHIHPVVVPLHLTNKHIGEAVIIAARHRPKYVGGERAVYDMELE